ncbi:MAG: DUF4340 domain-containing protein [Anaerolineae bacterium]|nr:DUF4340 domain-containing protein [Anaerolineae bacterium]
MRLKNRGTLLLIVVSLGVIGLALLLLNQQQTTPAAGATPAPAALFAGLNQIEVARLSVRDEAAGLGAVYVQQEDGSWALESSDSGTTGDLTQTTVDEAVGGLLGLNADSFASTALADFGLETPALTVSFAMQDGTARTLRLGNRNPAGNRYYALLDDDTGTVYLVGGVGVITQLTNLATHPAMNSSSSSAMPPAPGRSRKAPPAATRPWIPNR